MGDIPARRCAEVRGGSHRESEVIIGGAAKATDGLDDLHHRGQEDADHHEDDGDDHQQFEQCPAPAAAGRVP
jgi:hypothetical protein